MVVCGRASVCNCATRAAVTTTAGGVESTEVCADALNPAESKTAKVRTRAPDGFVGKINMM